jgi:N-methylhydantoinase B/oxoprolinase/acetone carboxylase alpha subunit
VSDDVNAQVAALEALRVQVAELTRRLGERELDGRLLRERLAHAARAAGATKTDAAEGAKTAAPYVEHERASLALAYERDVALATADAMRFRVQLALGERG